jgi:hypothetical protein
MRRFIFVLSLCVFGFAAFTIWDDPTTGPYIKRLIPEGSMPSIAGISSSTQSENLGGMTAANRVTSSVVNAVSN